MQSAADADAAAARRSLRGGHARNIGLVIVLSEGETTSKEIAWDHVDRVAARRRTGLKTTGAYESFAAAV